MLVARTRNLDKLKRLNNSQIGIMSYEEFRNFSIPARLWPQHDGENWLTFDMGEIFPPNKCPCDCSRDQNVPLWGHKTANLSHESRQ